MSRVALVIALCVVLFTPAGSHALFHLAHIDEVASGHGADPSAQYVEIRMLAFSQDRVKHTRLTAFSCDGATVTVLINDLPSDICNQGNGLPWTMGTATWASSTGITPDFTFTAGIPTPCGQICWGAPGSILPPADPNTWAASNPDNYVDCVAYGGYTGPRQTGDAAASLLAPGDGLTMSLQRTGDTGNDSTDFALAASTPTNNGTCPTTSTTTSTTSTTATTTTTLVQSKCTAKKLQLAGKKALAILKCRAKEVKKGTVGIVPCTTVPSEKFSKGWGKAEAPGNDCLTTGDEGAIETKVDNFTADVDRDLAPTAGPSGCSANKRGLAGTKTSAKAKGPA